MDPINESGKNSNTKFLRKFVHYSLCTCLIMLMKTVNLSDAIFFKMQYS